MSYSTHNVHEIIGINVKKVENHEDIKNSLGDVVPFQTQTVTFFFKGGGTHEITVFYEPGAETMKPRKYPETVVKGDYKKENFPKDYVL